MNTKYQGVIIQSSPSDFIAGTSPLKLEPRVSLGDWLQFYGTPELQAQVWGDTQGCVSFTAVHHCASPQIQWAYDNNLFPKKTRDWLEKNNYIVDGKVNLSERFIVVKSGTGQTGNSANNVLQAVRNSGIVPEWACSNQGPTTREQYFTTSDEANRLGQESLKYLTWGWQLIPEYLVNQYIVQAPVMTFIPICAGYGQDAVVKTCNQQVQHSVGAYKASDPNKYVYDSYVPFQKKLSYDYPTPFRFQLLMYVVPQTDVGIPKPHYVFNVNLKVGDRGQDVLNLQHVLECPLTGVYDEDTRSAVFQFQLNHLPTYLEMVRNLFGRYCGPKTRLVLNQIQ